MQGVIIPTGGTIFSQVVLFITMIMGIYYTLKTINLNNKPIYFKGLNALFLMSFIYGFVLLFSSNHYEVKAKLFDNEVSNFSYLKYILLSLPNIYAFYYFSRMQFLTEPLLKKWVLVFFGIAIFRFFDYQTSTLNILVLNGQDVSEVTNNMGYLFVALIPAIVVYKGKLKLQYGLLIICMLFIVLGMKRGAMLIGTISFICFVHFTFQYGNNSTRSKIVFLSLIFIALGIWIVDYMMETSDFFMSRIISTEEGKTSGRDEIYKFFWDHFRNEEDILKFLFGNGANATLQIGINYAHNDWLEIAINQGVLGLIVYLIYWICFFKTVKATRNNKEIRLIMILTFVAFFIKTFFSMSYTDYSMVTCSVFGYSLAHYKDNE